MMTREQEAPLAVKIYSERDADLDALRGSTIGVIGYGNQGHAHALNLRDSGLKVVVGQRPDGPGWRRAVSDDPNSYLARVHLANAAVQLGTATVEEIAAVPTMTGTTSRLLTQSL